MADENGDVKQASLEDSNIAGIGSQENRDLRKEAAASDTQFSGAGDKAGIEIWRVENRRTESDTPDFGVKRWSKENYGDFYTGDSYLIMNTYNVKDPETGRKTDKLAWDVHFWLGESSSQDEIGVAAYKAVELDDLLDDGPIQHREVQGHESRLFQSYFPAMKYMEGGIASGFRHVKPEEYKPRLMRVKRTKKTVRSTEVPVAASSLNHGDVFILDAGLKVYTWFGDESNAFEKSKGGALAHNIVDSRLGKARKGIVDDKFWSILGGSEDDVQPAVEDVTVDKAIEPENCKLLRISDSTGTITFKEEAEGELNTSMLDSNDAFVIDGGVELFVWIGKNASHKEKSQAMKLADSYLHSENKPKHTPVTRVNEGQLNTIFQSCFSY